MRLLRSLPLLSGTRTNTRRLSSAFLVFLCYAMATAQTTRGFEQTSAPASIVSPGTYYALVIGIDNYRSLPRLTTAVHDAQAIGGLLESSFGFQGHTTYLLNQDATRAHIMDALEGARGYTQTLGELDNLLIYYAGHGYYDKRTDKAYWLPYDAESAISPNHISSDDLTTAIRGLSSRHVLVISDSCYSGDLTRGVDDSLTSIAGEQAFINRMISAPSRNLLSSGGNEPVSDSGPSGHSIFAAALLHALTEQSGRLFTAADLADPVKKMVRAHSPQIPEYSRIGNSMPRDFPIDIGDFVFTRTGARQPLAAASAPPALAPARTLSPTPAAPAPSPTNDESFRGRSLFIAKRFTEAAPILADACDQGSAISCVDLGSLYKNGVAVEKDPARAATLFSKACDGGNAAGCTNLGVMYRNGQGVEKDEARASTLYRKACDGGSAAGCANLAVLYRNGVGVEKDLAQSVELSRKACDAGELQGCSNLGMAYERGEAVERNPVQASVLFRKACDGRDTFGCVQLGLNYENGLGVEKDLSQAIALFRKACDGGDSVGCRNLGIIYESGLVVSKDTNLAVEFYQKACEAHDSRSCDDLNRLKR